MKKIQRPPFGLCVSTVPFPTEYLPTVVDFTAAPLAELLVKLREEERKGIPPVPNLSTIEEGYFLRDMPPTALRNYKAIILDKATTDEQRRGIFVAITGWNPQHGAIGDWVEYLRAIDNPTEEEEPS